MHSQAVRISLRSFSTKFSTELLKTFTLHSHSFEIEANEWLVNCNGRQNLPTFFLNVLRRMRARHSQWRSTADLVVACRRDNIHLRTEISPLKI